jgi:hypothetical protein
MKTELTQSEKDLMPQIVEKWIKWGTQETNTDVTTIQKNMRWLYEQAGLAPVPVIVCDTQQHFNDEISQYVKGSSVGSSMWSSMWSLMGSSVGSSVGSYYWADDISYYDFFKEIGVVTDKKLISRVEKYKDALSDTSVGFITDKICIVLRKPKVRLNDEGMLHSDEFPSVEWKDGEYSQYHLNGVQFERKLWKRVVSGEMPFKDILAIKDTEQRTQAMKYSNVWDFLKFTEAKHLDEYQKMRADGKEINYYLYKVPAGKDVFDETSYFTIYDCPSTGKLYMSGIAPEVGKKGNLPEAMAWKFSTDVDSWKRLVPMETES